jgi:hypothetical protein
VQGWEPPPPDASDREFQLSVIDWIYFNDEQIGGVTQVDYVALLQDIGLTAAEAAIVAAADYGVVTSFAEGTNSVPFDSLAFIHQGEAIIPADQVETIRSATTNTPIMQDNSRVVEAIETLTRVLVQTQEDSMQLTEELIVEAKKEAGASSTQSVGAVI